MRTLKQMISTGLFGLLLLGGTEARSAEARSDIPPSVPDTRVPPLVPRDSGTANGEQATKPEPGPRNPERRVDQPEAPGHAAREIAENLQQAAEELKQARSDFIKQQRDLKKRAIEAQRDQIRAKLREDRPAFPTLRPDTQQDFLDRVTALKEQLRNHGEVLDEAKLKAQERVKTRKDGE